MVVIILPYADIGRIRGASSAATTTIAAAAIHMIEYVAEVAPPVTTACA